MPRIKLSPFTLIITILVCCSMKAKMLVAILLSVFVHESGHIIAACLLGSEIESVCFTPLGVTIHRRAKITSYKNDIVIYAAGPLMNLALLGVGIISSHLYLVLCNLSLFLINILPIKVFDGGKILGALLSRFAPQKAELAIKAISAVFLFILWVCAVYILIVTSSNISPFLMCVYLFFAIFI